MQEEKDAWEGYNVGNEWRSGEGEVDAHSSDVLDSEALLDELNDHLELPALAGVAGVWDGDRLAGSILVEDVGGVVLVQRCHGEKHKRKERERERGAVLNPGTGREAAEDKERVHPLQPETATCRQGPSHFAIALHRSPLMMTALLCAHSIVNK